MAKYKVIARAKDSKCATVKVGDQIVIEDNMLNLKESKNVCVVALSAIQYSLFMMGKAKDPKDFGRDQTYILQCPDPDTRVIFEITRKTIPE
ncbi:MAG TPA: TIGR04076 family protein [Thermodesulfobacteriota bacterium]|nr:TIGR04076 family protein [Thermodesulfobacteriota bacterium]